MNTTQKEFEVRFSEIDVPTIKKKLAELGAKDQGEVLLRETIIYDKDLEWRKQNKFLRVRENGSSVEITYKHQPKVVTMGSVEIEFHADNALQAISLFEAIGLQMYRKQEKKRHTYMFGDITIDIDIWPKVPPYIEIEGPSEAAIKVAVTKLGLDWEDAIFENARAMVEKKYGIPMSDLKYFTFDRVE